MGVKELFFGYMFIIAITSLTVNGLRCYTGQHVKAPPPYEEQIAKSAGSLPIVRSECGDNEDACLTVNYEMSINVIVLTVNASVTQGICGSSVVGCTGFCTTLQNTVPLIQDCQCCATKACNDNQLKQYDSGSNSISQVSFLVLAFCFVLIMFLQ